MIKGSAESRRESTTSSLRSQWAIKGTIFSITNSVNDKYYIGYTMADPNKKLPRFRAEYRHWLKGKRTNHTLYQIMKEVGDLSAFKMRILETHMVGNVNELKQYFKEYIYECNERLVNKKDRPKPNDLMKPALETLDDDEDKRFGLRSWFSNREDYSDNLNKYITVC